MIRIEDLLAYYSPTLHGRKKAILREYLQCKILIELYKHPFAQKLWFIGWTCLRLAYRSNRFSEDLDFDNWWLTESEFEEMTHEVKRALELEGYDTEIKHTYKWAFHCAIKIPNILFDNGLAPMTTEKLVIKVDTATQWLHYKTDPFVLEMFDFNGWIKVVPKKILCTMKILAFFNRVKGRDLYDLSFLFWQRIEPERNMLNDKLGITNRSECKNQMLQRMQWRNLEELNNDVAPFLFDSNSQAVKMFPQIIEQTQFTNEI